MKILNADTRLELNSFMWITFGPSLILVPFALISLSDGGYKINLNNALIVTSCFIIYNMILYICTTIYGNKVRKTFLMKHRMHAQSISVLYSLEIFVIAFLCVYFSPKIQYRTPVAIAYIVSIILFYIYYIFRKLQIKEKIIKMYCYAYKKKGYVTNKDLEKISLAQVVTVKFGEKILAPFMFVYITSGIINVKTDIKFTTLYLSFTFVFGAVAVSSAFINAIYFLYVIEPEVKKIIGKDIYVCSEDALRDNPDLRKKIFGDAAPPQVADKQ